jgi:hypothetical protein
VKEFVAPPQRHSGTEKSPNTQTYYATVKRLSNKP